MPAGRHTLLKVFSGSPIYSISWTFFINCVIIGPLAHNALVECFGIYNCSIEWPSCPKQGHVEDEAAKAAYRRLALRYHPDRNPAGRERFVAVQRAYERLQAGAAGGQGPRPANLLLLLKVTAAVHRKYVMSVLCSSCEHAPPNGKELWEMEGEALEGRLHAHLLKWLLVSNKIFMAVHFLFLEWEWDGDAPIACCA